MRSRENLQKTQLDERAFKTEVSGGPLILSEMIPGVRSVATGVWMRWGASNDVPAQMGASHLLEHMIFKGTKSRSAREIALEIEGIGGSLDAYTSREHTACYARVLDEHLPIAVDVLADLVLHPLLRESDLELERNVILEEIAGIEDTPEELVFELHARSVWGDHPYGNPVLGTAATVRAITLRDVRDLWSRVYRSNGCVVAAAGNVDHEQFVDLVLSRFPEDGERGVAGHVPEPGAVLPEERHVQRDTAQVHVCVGAPTCPRSDPRRYAAILVSTALGGGMSSRLFHRVREEQGLAYTIYSYQSFYARGGLAGVYMATRPDMTKRAVDEVRGELEQLARAGLEAEELEAVKSQMKGQLVLSLESPAARLQRLVGVALYDEPYLTLDEICGRIDAVSEREVAELCREYYAPEVQAIVRLGPDGRARVGEEEAGVE